MHNKRLIKLLEMVKTTEKLDCTEEECEDLILEEYIEEDSYEMPTQVNGRVAKFGLTQKGLEVLSKKEK